MATIPKTSHPVLPQGFDGAEAASSGRNEVLDNNDLSVLPAFALYLIVQPWVFGELRT